jgi:hypothetical protein
MTIEPLLKINNQAGIPESRPWVAPRVEEDSLSRVGTHCRCQRTVDQSDKEWALEAEARRFKRS